MTAVTLPLCLRGQSRRIFNTSQRERGLVAQFIVALQLRQEG
jgi:hypothetical protein